jgi:hypothetical protein
VDGKSVALGALTSSLATAAYPLVVIRFQVKTGEKVDYGGRAYPARSPDPSETSRSSPLIT